MERTCPVAIDAWGFELQIGKILNSPLDGGDWSTEFLCRSTKPSPPSPAPREDPAIGSSWNVMAHGNARKGKWRGNWRMEWVASTLHSTSERGVSSITTANAHTSAASSRLNWRPAADLNGSVRFAERLNLISARVPSHFNWPIPIEQGKLRAIDSAGTWHPRWKSIPICSVRIAVTRLKLPHAIQLCKKNVKIYVRKYTVYWTSRLGFFFIFVKKNHQICYIRVL